MRSTTTMIGLIVLDKPTGITSREALDRAVLWFPRRTKVGHTGTLDPRATGVLVMCVGLATRLAEFVQELGKTYQVQIRLGATSDTEDADGTITETPGVTPIAEEAIRTALKPFQGIIEQRPPSYSAVKIDGVRAHKLARKGRDIDITARPVRIDDIRWIRYEWPYLYLEIDCGKGTYIRSIARDLGESLGCGALVQELRRTRVGHFRAEDAVPWNATPTQARARLLPMGMAVSELPKFELSQDTIARLQLGQRVKADHRFPEGVQGAVFDTSGELRVVVYREGDLWNVVAAFRH